VGLAHFCFVAGVIAKEFAGLPARHKVRFWPGFMNKCLGGQKVRTGCTPPHEHNQQEHSHAQNED
jgi:hypothetical protein